MSVVNEVMAVTVLNSWWKNLQCRKIKPKIAFAVIRSDRLPGTSLFFWCSFIVIYAVLEDQVFICYSYNRSFVQDKNSHLKRTLLPSNFISRKIMPAVRTENTVGKSTSVVWFPIFFVHALCMKQTYNREILCVYLSVRPHLLSPKLPNGFLRSGFYESTQNLISMPHYFTRGQI